MNSKGTTTKPKPLRLPHHNADSKTTKRDFTAAFRCI
jgi:hypothetical protein